MYMSTLPPLYRGVTPKTFFCGPGLEINILNIEAKTSKCTGRFRSSAVHTILTCDAILVHTAKIIYLCFQGSYKQEITQKGVY
jgi:hypothetical protein